MSRAIVIRRMSYEGWLVSMETGDITRCCPVRQQEIMTLTTLLMDIQTWIDTWIDTWIGER